METEEEFIEHLRMNSKEVNEESLKKVFMLLNNYLVAKKVSI